MADFQNSVFDIVHSSCKYHFNWACIKVKIPTCDTALTQRQKTQAVYRRHPP